MPLRQVFGLRGTNHSTIHLQPRLPILGGQCLCTCTCGLRSLISLRDSPGIVPGSLLPQPRKCVVVPEMDNTRDQLGDSRGYFSKVWLACRILLSPPASYPAPPVLCMSHTTGPPSGARRGRPYLNPGQRLLRPGLQPGGPPSVRTVESGCSIVCVPAEHYGRSSLTS